MTRTRFTVAALLTALLPAGALAGTPQTDAAPPADIDTYLTPDSTEAPKVNDTVRQLLTDAGRTTGFQGGKAQRAHELRQGLVARDAELSRMYDFRPLLSSQGWLPPVIDAAQDMAHITDNQIRTAFRTYNILIPARFVSNPPGWRTYLFTGLADGRIAPPDASVRPKNDDESVIWQRAVRQGWAEGRTAADHTLEASFNRLTRDYTGMLRYSTLLQQGLIEAPDITEQQQSVTGNRHQLLIGDKVRRIREPAGFVTDKKRWSPAIHRGK